MAALTLEWMGQPSFYHATVALSFQIEICNLDRTKFSFLATSLYQKVIFNKNWVTRFCRPSDDKMIIAKWSATSLSCGCYGVYSAILATTNTVFCRRGLFCPRLCMPKMNTLVTCSQTDSRFHRYNTQTSAKFLILLKGSRFMNVLHNCGSTVV